MEDKNEEDIAGDEREGREETEEVEVDEPLIAVEREGETDVVNVERV